MLGAVDTTAKKTSLDALVGVNQPFQENTVTNISSMSVIGFTVSVVFSLYICLGDLTSNVNLSKGFGSSDFERRRLGFDFLS